MVNIPVGGQTPFSHIYYKVSPQRKGVLPDEVLEVHISEKEYVHFEVIGHALEADILDNNNNRKRYGQDAGNSTDVQTSWPQT